jgi:predicted dehydrogenase
MIRIGLIGVGHRASMAAGWENDPRAKIVAGADINEVFLKQFKEKYSHNNPFITRDFRELISREDIDAVGVFTPDFMHCEHTVEALQAGKHVYVEKPMATTTRQCDEMLRAGENSAGILMVGHNLRYSKNFLVLKRIIDTGELGKIKALWVRHFLGSAGYNWFHDYRATRIGSNSMLLGKGSHDIDMIHFLSGRYTRRVTAMGSRDYFGGDKPNDLRCENCDEKNTCSEFSARDVNVRSLETYPKTKCVFRKEVDIEDHSMMLMDLGDIHACYLECHYTACNLRNYLVVGTKGQAELSDNTITITTQKANKTKALSDVSFATALYEISGNKGGHGGADPQISRDFLDLIIDGKQPLVKKESGRMAVAAGCAAIESLRNNSIPVEVESYKP